MVNDLHKIYNDELKPRKYKTYKQRMFSEEELFIISSIIKSEEKDIELFTNNLLTDFIDNRTYSKELDWNIGSTIQHFDPHIVISAFKKIRNPDYLKDSIGLTWVLGEYKINDPDINSFLYDVIRNGRDSETWWRAAFSLEKVGVEDAIILLKRALKSSGLKNLQYYFDNIGDKKSIIGILLKSTKDNLRAKIYPFLKETFINSDDKVILINCAWLLGRFKLMNKDILERILRIINTSSDYELIYYTFFAIQETASPLLTDVFIKFINHDDALLRKMAIRGLSYVECSNNQLILEKAFRKESNPYVLAEISQGLYRAKNVLQKSLLSLKQSYNDIENGLIIDDSDKWYADPSIYEMFSYAEDPENICLKVIEDEINRRFQTIKNPIDLATGTGRAFRYFINRINFTGTYYAIDRSSEMLKYLEKTINRNHNYIYDYKLINKSLDNFDLKIESDFIVSSFGFPSKFTNKDLCMSELETVHNHLSPEGVFITLGWDESFNDELNLYWFKYIPDDIKEFDFEEWRKVRVATFDSPRNCQLKWYKKGIIVPLQFNNIKESVHTMGHLFGRDAALSIIKERKTEWSMSLGITLNTKNEIKEILENYKKK